MKTRPKLVEIIGAPLDLGCNLRGANIAPATVRIAGLQEKLAALGVKSIDGGDVAVPLRETLGEAAAKERYLTVIAGVCDELFARVTASLQAERFPLIIGGDHSIAVGTIKGAGDFFHRQGGQLGLVWIDAHADMNTPDSSPSGNVHGMPLAVCLGKGAADLTSLAGGPPALDPRHVALLGVRDLDADERRIVKASGVRCFTMSEIDERGIAVCLDEAFARATAGTAGVHLSFDLDGVDPEYAPGVGTPVAGGLTYREAHLACEKAAQTGRLLGMDLVELNPILDEGNRTAKLAVELILSAFGKTIL